MTKNIGFGYGRSSTVHLLAAARPIAERAGSIDEVRINVWPELAAGRVKPVIAHRLPLAGPPRPVGCWSSG